MQTCGCFKQFWIIVSVKILQALEKAKMRARQVQLIMELIQGYWSYERGKRREEKAKKELEESKKDFAKAAGRAKGIAAAGAAAARVCPRCNGQRCCGPRQQRQ